MISHLSNFRKRFCGLIWAQFTKFDQGYGADPKNLGMTFATVTLLQLICNKLTAYRGGNLMEEPPDEFYSKIELEKQ